MGEDCAERLVVIGDRMVGTDTQFGKERVN
jgi:hypothetical protein